jgi:glycosyltransferase involved in cell wall biosynthesis
VADAQAVLAAAARVAVVGLSIGETCGVRDHAQLLAGELERQGLTSSLHWLNRTESSLSGSRREIGAWVAELRRALAAERPSAVVVHYSVFSYSYRGVPLFVPEVFAALRGADAPAVGFLHEIVYGWRRGGWRGKVWAASQRLALVEVMRRLDAAVLTAQERAQWLQARPWFPRRPLTVAPVYSNLPPPRGAAPLEREEPVVGLFGYAYQGAAVRLLLDGLAEVRARGTAVRLLLLGAPGPRSHAAELWRSEARSRGMGDAVSFSGRLPAQELSDALAACDVLLFADAVGPTSRKGSLAGSVASGRPVVALDGPQTWPELRDAGAVRIAAPTPGGLADALAELLASPAARAELGARGRAFAESRMSLRGSAAAVLEALGAAQAAARREPAQASAAPA